MLSFGYWTTNFVEVQRAMASKSITAARMTPIIGAFPKMFIPPFIVIIPPGMIAAVLVNELTEFKQLDFAGDADGAAATGVTYNDALLLLMREVLPNGLLGVAIAGLLAAFMAGMAANISAFNTVVTYDLYEQYVKKDAPRRALHQGRPHRDRRRLRHRHLHRPHRRSVLQPDGLPADAVRVLQRPPLFATFILGMFWKRMTPPAAGWSGLVSGTLAAVILWSSSTFFGLFELPGQGLAFVSAATAFVVDIIVSVVVTQFTTPPKPVHELKGLVYSETPPKTDLVDPDEKELPPFYRRPVPMAGIGLVLVIILNVVFA